MLVIHEIRRIGDGFAIAYGSPGSSVYGDLLVAAAETPAAADVANKSLLVLALPTPGLLQCRRRTSVV